MTQLRFLPATIRHTRNRFKASVSYRTDPEAAHVAYALNDSDVEFDYDATDRLLIGVPAGHDRVFTVGPYTITIED